MISKKNHLFNIICIKSEGLKGFTLLVSKQGVSSNQNGVKTFDGASVINIETVHMVPDMKQLHQHIYRHRHPPDEINIKRNILLY